MLKKKLVTLAMNDPKVRSTLWNGEMEEDGKFFRALPFETNSKPGNPPIEQVVFALEDLSVAVDRPSFFLRWLITFRVFSLSATAAACIATLLYGWNQGWEIYVPRATLAWVGAVLLQLAINLFNDVEDHLRLIDLPGQQGGSGALQKGWFSARRLNQIGWVCCSLAVFCGLPSLVAEPKLLFLPLIFAAIGVVGYSGWPFEIKYRALGDITVLFLCGPLLTLAYCVASFGNYDRNVILLGLSLGCAALSILHANNLQDIEIDRLRHTATLANIISFSVARQLLGVFYFFTIFFLGYFALAANEKLLFIIGAFATPIFIRLSRRSYRSSGPYSPLLQSLRVDTAKAHLQFGSFVCAGLVAFHFLNF